MKVANCPRSINRIHVIKSIFQVHFLSLSLLIMGFMLLPSHHVYAQSNSLNPDLSNMTLPSPSASALGKFGSIPVTQSNGLPKISIPVFSRGGSSIKCGLNISLDYHAGGIRVDEVSSNVGLGWALNAGGVVTRTIRGLPDEMDLPDRIGYLSSRHAIPAYSGGLGTAAGATSTYFTPGGQISDGRLDNQIDIYSFNFNGHSGRFLLGKNGDVLITPDQKLLIEKVTGNGSSVSGRITITDEAGFKYIFAEEEQTYSNTTPTLYPTSWYLSKIINVAKTDSISFQYELFNGSYTLCNTAAEVDVLTNGYTNEYGMYIFPPTPQSTYTEYPVIQGGVYKRLTKILLSDSTEIEFVYDTQNRTDWTSDKALKNIFIRNTGKLYKKFLLEQHYASNRLFLDKVISRDAMDLEIGNYIFDYESPDWLPARLSKSQDHWGFANLNEANKLIPKEYYLGNTFIGGNRNANGYAIRGALKKITYPTKGYTTFEMEPNRARDPSDFDMVNYYVDGLFNYANSNGQYNPEDIIGGLRVRKITDYDGINANPSAIREYSYVDADGKSTGTIANYPRYSYGVFYEFDYTRPSSDQRYPTLGYWDWPYKFYPIPGYPTTYTQRPFTVVQRLCSSLSNLDFSMGSPVTYKRVEEKLTNGGTGSIGRTVRTFTAFWDFGPPANYSSFNFPVPPAYVSDWLYGLTKSELTYDNSGKPVQKIENVYDNLPFTNSARLQNFRSITIAPVKFTSTINHPTLGGPAIYWLLNNFYPVSGHVQLASTTITNYSGLKDSLVTKTTSAYDSVSFNKISDTYQKSDGSFVKTTYKYPNNMVSEGKDQTGIYSQMISRNIISPIIEQVDTLINGSVKQQIKWVGYQFSIPIGGFFLPKSSAVRISSYAVDTVSKFNRYNTYGNIVEQQKVNGPKEVYLWGYHGQYPVAKISNSDYLTVNSVVTPTQIDNAIATGDAALRILLNTLRTDSRLKGAQVITYTYDPIAGMTSVSDVKGMTTFYEYDGFQRLRNIRDYQRNIVKSFDYNYRPQ